MEIRKWKLEIRKWKLARDSSVQGQSPCNLGQHCRAYVLAAMVGRYVVGITVAMQFARPSLGA
jgi:hypothetical protein